MKPILFNTDMVRAILEGRKTVTRRVLKQPFTVHPSGFITKPKGNECLCPYVPPYKVNDILYVRETWRELIRPVGTPTEYTYKADTDKRAVGLFKWKPSIHMPKEAARLFLKVTGVKVAKLRDMELIDFLNEGIIVPPDPVIENEKLLAMDKFIDLWNSTAGKKGTPEYYANNWYGNPYVWVIEFEVISREQAEEE